MFSIEDDVVLEYETDEEDTRKEPTQSISEEDEISSAKQSTNIGSKKPRERSKVENIAVQAKASRINTKTKNEIVESSVFREQFEISRKIRNLYLSLGVRSNDRHAQLHSVYAHGVEDLSVYQIQRIFAEYEPSSVEMVNSNACNVFWEGTLPAAKMMLGMTKELRRIRRQRQFEEGEVLENPDEVEEDGEMREEYDDYVTIEMNRTDREAKRITREFVEISIDEMDLPPGRWRVVVKHVDKNRLILVRFSTRDDILKGRKKTAKPQSISVTANSMIKEARVRPGLNIFDDYGNELEWDYEHDTRFYEKQEEDEQEEPVEPLEEAVQSVDDSASRKRRIVSRGRGAKRYKFSGNDDKETDSMQADLEQKRREERKREMDMLDARKESDEYSDNASDDDANRFASVFQCNRLKAYFRH